MQIKVVRASETLTSDSGLATAIDSLGKQSAIAQSLSREITSAELLAMPRARDQRQVLFLAFEDGKVLGFLKSGVKHLFYVVRTKSKLSTLVGHRCYD